MPGVIYPSSGHGKCIFGQSLQLYQLVDTLGGFLYSPKQHDPDIEIQNPDFRNIAHFYKVDPFTYRFRIGGQMTVAKEIMTTDVITLTPDTDIARAAQILLDNGINGAPVVDDQGRLIGILCQSDLVSQQKKLPLPGIFTLLDAYITLPTTKHIEKQISKITALKVSEAMTPDPVTIGPDTDIESIAALMVDKKYHTLPVVDAGKVVGIVGKKDVLRTLLATS
jgi:CBS domain-containing protein